MNAMTGNTWTLVTNGGFARIFRLGRKAGEIEEVQQIRSGTMHLTTHELVSDSAPRFRTASGAGGHTKQARTDPHELNEQRFIQGVMRRLKHAAQQGLFKRLVICADPRSLGRLRQCMPHVIATRLVMEVDSDLTAWPRDEIDRKVRALF